MLQYHESTSDSFFVSVPDGFVVRILSPGLAEAAVASESSDAAEVAAAAAGGTKGLSKSSRAPVSEEEKM